MGCFEAVCGGIHRRKLRFEGGDEQFGEPFGVLPVAKASPAAQLHLEGVAMMAKVDLDLNLFHSGRDHFVDTTEMVTESGP